MADAAAAAGGASVGLGGTFHNEYIKAIRMVVRISSISISIRQCLLIAKE